MNPTATRAAMAAACLLSLTVTKADAHVKWFLGRSEAAILQEPKPELFTHLSPWNLVPIVAALLAIVATTLLAARLTNWQPARNLSLKAQYWEAHINAFLGASTGSFLIYCALTHVLLTPNFIICVHCPQWLPYAEGVVGFSILSGLFARLGGFALIGLLLFTLVKHSLADCLDLIPLYGLALYFVLVGRPYFSLGKQMLLERETETCLVELGHRLLRWFAGAGLVVLALDEKLLHPQLAMELLKQMPSLNAMSHVHMGNDLFVLCAGLTELVLGLLVAAGTFPRLGVIALATVFAGTTMQFGTTELFGHLPYYGIIAAVALRGSGTIPTLSLCKTTYRRLIATRITAFQNRLA